MAWGSTIRRLFAHYIDVDYLKDELFLKAAFLDPNCGPALLDTNTEAAAKRLVLHELRVLVDKARDAAQQEEQQRLYRERNAEAARSTSPSTMSTMTSFLPAP
jgi:hypothetical protein